MEKTFKYTDEQLLKIYEGDIDARNTFYFDNLDIITRIAQNTLNREKHPAVQIDDLLQGVYLDMDYFCHSVDRRVTNYAEIACFIRWSCHVAPYGGLAYCREHNPKVACASYFGYFNSTYTDNNLVRLDALMRENSEKRGTATFEEYVGTADECDELAIDDSYDSYDSDDNIDEYAQVFGEYLSPSQREVFVLMLDGYTATQIAERLGLKLSTVCARQDKLRKVFNKRIPEVVKTLADFGIQADGIADRQPKHFYKTSEKEREAMRRYSERKRERKRAESDPQHDDVA